MECWFSILSRGTLQGASFTSVIDGQIEDYSGRATKATKAAIALDFEDPC